mmetsp:Transcript_53908/g.139307  ORF Transcript_53908/g.139307 Transcript_53908/m.139307 type:complete len:106 (-) Transcript_53908:472-789(-)
MACRNLYGGFANVYNGNYGDTVVPLVMHLEPCTFSSFMHLVMAHMRLVMNLIVQLPVVRMVVWECASECTARSQTAPGGADAARCRCVTRQLFRERGEARPILWS